MKRVPVVSESIGSIGYSASQGELEIEFRQSGAVYRYFQVALAEYSAFMAAESKGTHLNHVFKAKNHPFILVNPGRGPEP